MDSSIVEKLKALNQAEKQESGTAGTLLDITIKLENDAKEMRSLMTEARKTVDSSVTVLMTINLLLGQIKSLAESVNRLYVQMIGADKAGLKKSRKTFFKGVLVGMLAGMAAWLVIAVIFK